MASDSVIENHQLLAGEFECQHRAIVLRHKTVKFPFHSNNPYLCPRDGVIFRDCPIFMHWKQCIGLNFVQYIDICCRCQG